MILQYLQKPLQLKIKEIEKETFRNKRLVLNVALNYGGRLDIVNSVNKFYNNKKKIKKITEKILIVVCIQKGSLM